MPLAPNDADTYINRGHAYAKQGAYDRAIQDYDQALRIAPDSGEAYLGRGDAYSSKGQFDQAIQSFDQAPPPRPELCRRLPQSGIRLQAQGPA